MSDCPYCDKGIEQLLYELICQMTAHYLYSDGHERHCEAKAFLESEWGGEVVAAVLGVNPSLFRIALRHKRAEFLAMPATQRRTWAERLEGLRGTRTLIKEMCK